MAAVTTLHSRRIHAAAEDDPFEFFFEQGLTDGLPVVPPTEERVQRMLAETKRDPQEVLGTIGPNYGRATVEKVAINAVMAGCHPSYFPTILAVAEALSDEKFNAHALNVTTFSATPLTIINGPVRNEIGVNCGHNALGHGFRANATIGRMVRLCIMNIGGAKPHQITKATMGHPAQYTFCVGENEEESPWEPLHVEKGFRLEQSTVTLFGGHSPFRSTTTPAVPPSSWRSRSVGRWRTFGTTKIFRFFPIPFWPCVQNTPKPLLRMVGRRTISASSYSRRFADLFGN